MSVQTFATFIKVDADVDVNGVATKYLRRAIFEKQLTGLHVVRIIIFLSDMCF